MKIFKNCKYDDPNIIAFPLIVRFMADDKKLNGLLLKSIDDELGNYNLADNEFIGEEKFAESFIELFCNNTYENGMGNFSFC